MPLLRNALQMSLGRRLPMVDGELFIRGISAPLTIRRDRYDIPYIDAQDDAGAWFGLGYCQAQDRAFQLELRLRMVRGTLSELFGETVALDRLARRIGCIEASTAAVRGAGRRRAGDKSKRLRAASTRASRQAPQARAGVRLAAHAAYAVDRRRRASVQGKLISFLMIGNWDVELARLKILMTDGEQALRDLDPTYPASHAVTTPGHRGRPRGRPAERRPRARPRAGGGMAAPTPGRSPVHAPRRDARSSPATRTSTRGCRRTGTWRTCARRSGRRRRGADRAPAHRGGAQRLLRLGHHGGLGRHGRPVYRGRRADGRTVGRGDTWKPCEGDTRSSTSRAHPTWSRTWSSHRAARSSARRSRASWGRSRCRPSGCSRGRRAAC